MIFLTPNLDVEDLPADSRHMIDALLTPLIIALHATAGRNSRAWLTTDPRSDVSCHRLIEKDGTIVKLVDDTRVAHHVGGSAIGRRRNLNGIALGIELENLNDGRDPYPGAQRESCAAQIVEWWGAYGYLPILPHSLIDAPVNQLVKPKTDPVGFDWIDLYQRINRLLGHALFETAWERL